MGEFYALIEKAFAEEFFPALFDEEAFSSKRIRELLVKPVSNISLGIPDLFVITLEHVMLHSLIALLLNHKDLDAVQYSNSMWQSCQKLMEYRNNQGLKTLALHCVEPFPHVRDSSGITHSTQTMYSGWLTAQPNNTLNGTVLSVGWWNSEAALDCTVDFAPKTC